MLPNKRIRWRHWAYKAGRLRRRLRSRLARRLCSRSSGLCRRLRCRGRLEAVAIGCLADAAVSAGVVGGRHHREALAGDGIATFSGWARVERSRIRRVSSEGSLHPKDNGNSSVEGRGVAPSGAIHIMSVSPGYDASIDFVGYKGEHPSEYCLHAACQLRGDARRVSTPIGKYPR